MLRIAIVTGTRPGCLNEAVARWVLDVARRHADVEATLIDVGAYGLPPRADVPPRLGRYAEEHVRAWSRTVASFDGFVFVTPEYLLSASAGVKAAIDVVARDWHNKVAGFVGYGAQGAGHAVEDLRRALAAVGVATVAPAVALTLVPHFGGRTPFMPDEAHVPELDALLDQVISWANALQAVRLAIRSPADDRFHAAISPRSECR
ncbi:MAG TPA: NAD(P)H-dependent oxidoreductase [Caldimonas sp.]|nr:NAD(P)H-dependent oxidoreductase [Caldimonas sp.]